jgi:hypothetical protein
MRQRYFHIALLAALCANYSAAEARVDIAVYNPLNHGAGNAGGPFEDETALRLQKFNAYLGPHASVTELGVLHQVDPWYARGADSRAQTQETEIALGRRPDHTPLFPDYRDQLHLSPHGLTSTGRFVQFDPIAEFSAPTSGELTAPSIDSTAGLARGSVASDGRMGIKIAFDDFTGVDATPISEVAVQTTLSDKITVTGSGATAPLRVSFHAHADALIDLRTLPSLNLSTSFVSYAVAYQVAVFDRITPEHPYFVGENEPGGIEGEIVEQITGFRELWSTGGVYWVEAGLNPTSLPFTQRMTIESLGRRPTDSDGFTFTGSNDAFIAQCMADPASCGEETRDRFNLEAAKATNIFSASKFVDVADNDEKIYDDPMFPFEENPFAIIDVPTDREIEIVTNFFLVAACASAPLTNCAAAIDGSNTAALGLELLDPTTSYVSASGFNFPKNAVAPVPLPPTVYLLATACAGLIRRRQRTLQTPER